MIKYAKILDEELGTVSIALGTDIVFYKKNGFTKLDVEQSEKDNEWYLKDKCPHYTDEEKAAIERARLDALTLTPSDVERAIYYSDLGMDFEDLKGYIKEKAPSIDIKGLAIEFRANNFYRGAVDKNGNRIIDMIGALLGYTPEDMDYLFENKELPVKNKGN